jgi:tRNA 2-thiouridine synthesizing protein D
MHYAIATTWGPTDTTRASLPFIHDAVTIAVEGSHSKMIPVGPPSKFESVLANPNAQVMVCKPCAEARGVTEDMLVKNCNMAGMNDYYKEVSRSDSKAVTF